MSSQIDFIWGALPAPACYPTTVNDLINQLKTVLSGSLAQNFTGISVGVNPPSDLTLPWIQLDNAGRPVRWWVYLGDWLSPHPIPASSNERKIWVGLESDLVTYDGGDASAPSDTSGPMWAVDHNFDFRFPLGAGTSPDTYSGHTSTVGVGASVDDLNRPGQERHVLLPTEMATHTHGVPSRDDVGGGVVAGFDVNGLTNLGTLQTGDNSPADLDHPNMPPFLGVFFIKRTSRIYYKV